MFTLKRKSFNGFTLKSEAFKGFTLIELLVVMAIMSILAIVIIGGFRSSQMRSRDVQRKSDLKQMANALELFFQDYGRYPPANGTLIASCPYDATTGTGSSCSAGSEMTDSKTIYFKKVVSDPSGTNYIYKVSSDGQKYQAFAHLENTQDINIISGISVICSGSTGAAISANSFVCNFAVTSTNASATETLQ